MKKIGIALFLATLGIGLIVSNIFSDRGTGGLFNFSIGEDSVSGSGHAETQKREVSDFTGIEIGGLFEVELVVQNDLSLEIEADDNLLPFITTEVRNGVLHVSLDRKVKTRNPMRIRISAPQIDRINVSGAVALNARNLRNSELTVSGSGASKVNLAGQVEMLRADVSGASKLYADELNAADAAVEASGASNVLVNVTGELRATATGASQITYAGAPQRVVDHTSGSASVVSK